MGLFFQTAVSLKAPEIHLKRVAPSDCFKMTIEKYAVTNTSKCYIITQKI